MSNTVVKKMIINKQIVLLCLMGCLCIHHTSCHEGVGGGSLRDDVLLSKLMNYEFVQPMAIATDSSGDQIYHSILESGACKYRTSFVVSGRNLTFILDVENNRDLLGNNFFEKYYSKDNDSIVSTDTKLKKCFYHGFVRNSSNSFVTVSVTLGFSAMISHNGEIFYVEQLRRSPLSHIMYKSSDINIPHHTCGSNHDHVLNFHGAEEMSGFNTGHRKHQRVKRTTYKRYVELILVNDFSEYYSLQADVEQVVERSIEIANIIDGIYKPLGVRIALIGVEVWSDTDKTSITQDPSLTLDNFLHWRLEEQLSTNPNDNSQLITSIAFEGSTVGMARISSMCSSLTSGGVNQDHGVHAGSVASTIAHEMGHNFGLYHYDTERDCECEATEGCVMSSAASTAPAVEWSTCSKSNMVNILSSGLGACLYDEPAELYGGPQCGNAYKEDGEECDCGLLADCDDPCCDASTCKLHLNASCSDGDLCCDECKLLPASTVCREAENTCDLPEYCNGKSPNCPDNVYIQNGQRCDSVEQAYCYEGSCWTHATQCIRMWGEESTIAPFECYDKVNKQGTQYGNCGTYFNNNGANTYTVCQEDDVLCGKLQCLDGSDRPVLGATITNSIVVDEQVVACKGALIDQGVEMADPGLVLTGTICDDESICVDQRCQLISNISDIVDCPSKCSNKGVCNSKNHCHCDSGWGPPDCSYPGSGGSVDSGPMTVKPVIVDTGTMAGVHDSTTINITIRSETAEIMKTMLIVFFGIVPVIVILAVVIFLFRNQLMKLFFEYRLKRMSRPRDKMLSKRSAPGVNTGSKQPNHAEVGLVPTRLPPPPPPPTVLSGNSTHPDEIRVEVPSGQSSRKYSFPLNKL